MPDGAGPLRLRPAAVALMLGVSARKVQELCQRGALPAARIGRVWTIAPKDVQDYLRRNGNSPQPCHPISIAVAIPGGRASRSLDATTAKAYAQLISGKRSGASSR